jgi:hypothetical protein
MALCVQCPVAIEFDEKGSATNAICKNKARVRDSGNAPIYSCTNCNRLSARLYKLQNEDPSLKPHFQKLSPDAKKTFFAEHADFLGQDLVAAIKNLVSVVTSEESTEDFKGDGVWMDDEDLAAKFEGKPQQIAAIKKNTRTMMHPIRECILYEVIEYATTAATSTKRKQEERVEKETTEQLKKPRKAKAPPANLEGVQKDDKAHETATVGKELTDKMKERCTKLHEKFVKAKLLLADAVKNGKDEKYNNLIAPRYLVDAAESLLEVDSVIAEVELMLEQHFFSYQEPE